ncbi:MAG: hypothetical protein ACT4PY_17415 [Armatimonadota bacterium]
MDLSGFLRYWSLTLAVFVFYVFAAIVASLDITSEVREAIRKKRATRRGPALDPNPLTGRTVAETMLSGPGQRPDAKREWVAQIATDIAQRLNARVQTLVLEDSKGHPLVHFNDGERVQTYRIDRTLVESAMAGDTAKVAEVSDFLTRHLIADFLGLEQTRPPRTTELAREASSKPAAAAVIRPAGPAPAKPAAPAAEPSATAATAEPAPPSPAAPPAPGAEMSREERIAAARAKAEELKARARQQGKPPT